MECSKGEDTVIPYLEITGKRRIDINNALSDACSDKETFLGLRSVLEEFGDDFAGIERVFSAVEQAGNLSEGTWDRIRPIMEGERDPCHDWRGVPRSVGGF